MEAASHLRTTSLLAVALARCAAICDRTLDAYVAADPELALSEFARVLMAAVAAFETAAELEDAEPERRETALAVAAALGEEAAADLRRHGFDERLLRSAAACERAAGLCRAALARR